LLLPHDAELLAEDRIDFREDGLDAGDEFIDRVIGFEGSLAVRIDSDIPRAQGGESHGGSTLLQAAANCGEHGLRDGIMEGDAIIRRVVEAMQGGERVVAEVGKPGVVGDLLPLLELGIEDVSQLIALVDVWLKLKPEGTLAEIAVGIEHEGIEA
jgi:hypothetical protein